MSFNGWILKLWFIYKMEYYSAIKRNVLILLIDTTTWLNLKGSMWVKEASLKRLPAVWLHLYDSLKKVKQINKNPKVMESSNYHRVGFRGRCDYKGIPWEFFKMVELFCILTVVVVTWIYSSIRIHRTVHQQRTILLHINLKNKKETKLFQRLCHMHDRTVFSTPFIF